MPARVEVHGLRALNKALKEADPKLVKEAKAVAKDAAEIVATQARGDAPRRSGTLAGTVKAGATQSFGYVRAFTPYSGVIHFGWPRHHIKPNPFIYDALDARADEVLKAYEDRMEELIDKTFHNGVMGD